MIAAGVPIESVSGPGGGYRLASDQPLAPLTLDADEALKLYVVSLLDRRQSDEPDSDIPELGNTYSREALKRFAQRIYQALDVYETAAKIALEPVAAGFRNDDSRLRSTRSRALTE